MQQWNKRMQLGRTVFSWGCFLVLIVIGGCTSEQTSSDEAAPQAVNKENLPAHIQNLDSLSVYPVDAEPPDTVELVREQVFESNEDTYLDGYLGDIVVDAKNRVFIHVSRPGYNKIYVIYPSPFPENKFKLWRGKG